MGETNGSPTDVATKAIITAYLSALSSKADGARSVIADALIRNRGLTILHQNTPDLSDETKEIAQEIEDDARTDAEAILTALEANGLVIEHGWHPIETAPKDGRAMQLFIPDCGPDGKGIIASPRSQTDDGSWWDDELQEEIGWTSATHWRPLPEPPLAARGE